MSARVVLFDLDGTLSDSAPGILSALRRAFADHDVPPVGPATERALLGPPFYESLPPIVGEDKLWPVVESYRGYYAQTMFEAVPFPGVPELVAALHRSGRRLAVATSKPEHYAVPIVEHLGLARYFASVGGDELDGSLRTKALVIAKVLARLGPPDPNDVIMVGDRSHDVVGAREHGIECLGAGWGYALPRELESARPLQICATPAEVGAALGIDAGYAQAR
jgi:phosphoglycolate phosphatase